MFIDDLLSGTLDTFERGVGIFGKLQDSKNDNRLEQLRVENELQKTNVAAEAQQAAAKRADFIRKAITVISIGGAAASILGLAYKIFFRK